MTKCSRFSRTPWARNAAVQGMANCGTERIGGSRHGLTEVRLFPAPFGAGFKSVPRSLSRWSAMSPPKPGVEERLVSSDATAISMKAAAETLAADVLSRGVATSARRHLVGQLLCVGRRASTNRRSIPIQRASKDCGWLSDGRSLWKSSNARWRSKTRAWHGLRVKLSRKNPKATWYDVDFTMTTAQAIWREALIINPESWRGPADPATAFRSILDHLLEGGETDRTLIERLSDTPVADLATYPRRPEIWSCIGGVALQNLLATTTKGWLRQAASVGVPFVPEFDLQTAILKDDELEQTLDALIPDRVSTAVRLVAALGRYDQHQFLRLLRKSTSRTTSLAIPDAEGIGRLVLERRWADVAAKMVGQYRSGRGDLKPALRACFDILDLWERYLLGLLPVSEWEKWKAFEELAVQLYPGGPDDLELWERAGGDDADLSTRADGRTRWRKAVRNIRNGKGPTPFALLAAMMEDFPNNERIPHLAGDRVFGGGIAEGLRDE